jgi:hypothetical protein
MASSGRLEPCRRRQMRTRGGKAPISLWPRWNRPRVRAKSKGTGIDPAYTAPRARNLSVKAFTVSAGEGEEERRGRADIRLAAPLIESTGWSPLPRSRPCISVQSSAPSVEPLLHLSRCSHRPSAPARPPGDSTCPPGTLLVRLESLCSSASYAPCLLSGLLCSPASLLFLCFFPVSPLLVL